MTDLCRWCVGDLTATRREGGPRRPPLGGRPPSGTLRRPGRQQGTPPLPPATPTRSFAHLLARTARVRPLHRHIHPAGSPLSPTSALPAPHMCSLASPYISLSRIWIECQ